MHDRFTWSPGDVTIESDVEKHTPGGHEHDQDKHGDRGGTSSASVPTVDRAASEAAHDFIQRGDKRIVAQSGMIYGDKELDALRGQAKAKIVADVGARLEADESFRVTDAQRDMFGSAVMANDVVDRALRQWSSAAADSEPKSLAMQLAAAEEFDVPQESRLGMTHLAGTVGTAAARALYEEPTGGGPWSRSVLRPLLRSMYEHTQDELKAAGVERVTLYRGFSISGSTLFDKLPEFVKDGGVGPYTQNPISSWSADKGIATGFASGYWVVTDGKRYGTGRILTATFPRERILSTARTGLGSLPEYEYTILAGPGEVKVEHAGRD